MVIAAGELLLIPSSVDREIMMSLSVSMLHPRVSLEDQPAVQIPVPSVVTWGSASHPESVAAFVLRAAGALPLLPRVESRITILEALSMLPTRGSGEAQTSIQIPRRSWGRWGVADPSAKEPGLVVEEAEALSVQD